MAIPLLVPALVVIMATLGLWVVAKTQNWSVPPLAVGVGGETSMGITPFALPDWLGGFKVPISADVTGRGFIEWGGVAPRTASAASARQGFTQATAAPSEQHIYTVQSGQTFSKTGSWEGYA